HLGARNPELIRKCASVAMSLGEQHIAEEVLDVAIRIAIADDQILLERGRLFAAAGQGENAIRCFDHALLLRPTCADAYSLRGGVHLSQGQVEAGQEDLDRALALDPNNYLSLLQKARALQLESNLKEALALYNRA